jgi:hypothetical protein
MLNSACNHLGDLPGVGLQSSLLRRLLVSPHDNGVPKWLYVTSSSAACLPPCIDQVVYDTISVNVASAVSRRRENLRIGTDALDCSLVEVKYSKDGKIPIFSYWIENNRALVLKRSVVFWQGERQNRVTSRVTALTVNELIPDGVFEIRGLLPGKMRRIARSDPWSSKSRVVVAGRMRPGRKGRW